MLPRSPCSSVGFQLRISGLRERIGPPAAGLGWKLVLAPAVIAAVLALFTGPDTLAWTATVVQAATAPMVTGGIIVSQYDLDPPLAAAMVGLGTSPLRRDPRRGDRAGHMSAG